MKNPTPNPPTVKDWTKKSTKFIQIGAESRVRHQVKVAGIQVTPTILIEAQEEIQCQQISRLSARSIFGDVFFFEKS